MPSLGIGLGIHKVRPLAAKLLLDLVPDAAVALSTRQLSSAYKGPVVRVRRSSNDNEQDFTAKQITDGTLLAFCGAGNGFIVAWYDQSGNGRNATQIATGNQPRIVNNGVLEMLNGVPWVRNVANGFLRTAPYARTTNETIFAVGHATTMGGLRTLVSGDEGVSQARNVVRTDTATPTTYNFANASTNLPLAASINTSYIAYVRNAAGAGNAGFGLNGGTLTTGFGAANNASEGLGIMYEAASGGSFGRHWAGLCAEIIIYEGDQSANRSLIEANQAKHFGITLAS